jgi:hypothetical protein
LRISEGCLPRDRYELRLAKDAACWTVYETAEDVLGEHAPAAMQPFTSEMVARLIWDEWPKVSWSSLQVDIPGQQFPAEVVRIRVRLPECPAWLEWTSVPGSESLDVKGVDTVSASDLISLLRGRDLIYQVQRRIGRPTGWRAMPNAEFEQRLREAIVQARRDSESITSVGLARLTGDVPMTSFKRYLRQLGITLAQIQRGDWPKD